MKTHYLFDPEQRIWQRSAEQTIAYSDGYIVENRLLEVMKNSKDLSSTSTELQAAIQDWPSEYHLSWVRSNLLRSLQLYKTDEILELGCGCGAISRFLGETVAKVVAVEGSKERAKIAAERCRDLPNVDVYCDNSSSADIINSIFWNTGPADFYNCSVSYS